MLQPSQFSYNGDGPVEIKPRRQNPRHTPGVASHYIEHFEPNGTPVVLICRVSKPSQEQNGNLAEQVDKALSDLASVGVTPLKTLTGVETSNIFGERTILERAIAFARQNDAILVAPSRDRFLRRHGVGSGITKTNELPRAPEYERLLRMADGVRLATILDPDSYEARSEQIKRGQSAKGRRGGRPPIQEPGYTKRRRLNLAPRARELRRKGSSIREIARILGVPPSTIQGWVKGCTNFCSS